MSRRILFVIGNLQTGGAERHLSLLLPELKRRGWSPELYLYTEGRAFAPVLEAVGLPIIDGSGWAKPFHVLPSPFRGLMVRLMLILRLAAQLIGRRYDLLHGFLPQPCVFLGLAALLAWPFRRPPLLMSRRGMSDYKTDTPLEWRLECALMARWADVVLGNSRSICGQLAEEAVPQTKLAVIPNGVDAKALKDHDRIALRQAEAVAEDAFVMIVAASLYPWKGHALLFQALRRIADRLPENWLLLCAGGGSGAFAEQMQAEAQTFGDHVRMLGSRPDIHRLNAMSDLGILCSINEGMSNSLLEGMAAGLPFVATKVSGNAEVALEGQTALLVPADDPEALGQAILALAADPAKRREMGDAARRHIVAHYGFDLCASRYESLYLSLLAGSGIPEDLHPCA
jgi:glycosyltransferase involved in cell wall biosynthesis